MALENNIFKNFLLYLSLSLCTVYLLLTAMRMLNLDGFGGRFEVEEAISRRQFSM